MNHLNLPLAEEKPEPQQVRSGMDGGPFHGLVTPSDPCLSRKCPGGSHPASVQERLPLGGRLDGREFYFLLENSATWPSELTC